MDDQIQFKYQEVFIETENNLDNFYDQHRKQKRFKNLITKAMELLITVILIGGFIWLIK